jgi:hypothetical protein
MRDSPFQWRSAEHYAPADWLNAAILRGRSVLAAVLLQKPVPISQRLSFTVGRAQCSTLPDSSTALFIIAMMIAFFAFS